MKNERIDEEKHDKVEEIIISQMKFEIPKNKIKKKCNHKTTKNSCMVCDHIDMVHCSPPCSGARYYSPFQICSSISAM